MRQNGRYYSPYDKSYLNALRYKLTNCFKREDDWGAEKTGINYEEVASRIYTRQLKMREEAVIGQFDDLDDDIDASEPPPKLRRFEEMLSAERVSIDYTEDDGFPLRQVMNFFAVRNVMEKNDVPEDEVESRLVETLMELKKGGKKDFDIFTTKVRSEKIGEMFL